MLNFKYNWCPVFYPAALLHLRVHSLGHLTYTKPLEVVISLSYFRNITEPQRSYSHLSDIDY